MLTEQLTNRLYNSEIVHADSTSIYSCSYSLAVCKVGDNIMYLTDWHYITFLILPTLLCNTNSRDQKTTV